MNDTVMGGVSEGRLTASERGTVVFSGRVSRENGGGFASVRMVSSTARLAAYSGLELRVLGDGRVYQLRLRTDRGTDGVAYRARFRTTPAAWISIRIPFADFVPSFRGRVVRDAPPLDPDRIEQIGFLIADEQEGPFRLEVESVKAYREGSRPEVEIPEPPE